MNKEIVLPADIPYVQAVKVRAGNIAAIYEEGRLRYLKTGTTEIVRMIYPALRDENWNTIPSVRSEEKISIERDAFSISYTSLYSAGDIHYRAWCTIEGTSEGMIVFSMKGEALKDFSKRRIGLCLLHPVETCSGSRVTIIQPDGDKYQSTFPTHVSPEQPFFNVQAMKWAAGGDTSVEVRFEGDIFETEDQRNWSDNSYKTYSTPLSVPAPAFVRAGDTIEQKIVVRAVDGANVGRSLTTQDPIRVSFPRIGYARATGAPRLTDVQVGLLKRIPFDHYAVALDMKGEWEALLKVSAEEARVLGVQLALSVTFHPAATGELDMLIAALKQQRDIVYSLLVLFAGADTAPADFFKVAYQRIKSEAAYIRVGYGTEGYFADINMNRPEGFNYDFTAFHLQPQVHTNDNRSIMENLGSHQPLVASLQNITAGKAVQVSPIMFTEKGAADDRFDTAFCAWWTVQALRNLSAATALTLYEVTGQAGLLDGSRTTAVFKVFETIRNFSPAYVYNNTGNRVILENANGDQLIFTSELPQPGG